MASADASCHTFDLPVAAQDSLLSRRTSYSSRSLRSMMNSSKSSSGASRAIIARLNASHDLPSSVTRFLLLCSSSKSGAAKDLRRQLLVVRDNCVGLGNKMKGKELLSLGEGHVSRKVEATADFNSCLGVIFASSLMGMDGLVDFDKDTLFSLVKELKRAQESGDEKVFRAAIVTAVNRILLCTPLKPPRRNAAKEVTWRSTEGRQEHRQQEPKLKDECLDFLTVKDGAPVLLEGVWGRWLRYFEDGYARYVDKLVAEQHESLEAARDAAEADDKDEDEKAQHARDVLAAAAQTIPTVPFFTPWQDSWRAQTSAYAQFSCFLLAIFFVRTKDFSLNYLARVTKLVQYFTYQLEFKDGEPIEVMMSADAYKDSAQSDEEDEEDDDTTLSQQEEPLTGEHAHSLPMPEYDRAVTQRKFTITERSQAPELAPSEVQAHRAERSRSHSHKCFLTDVLPDDLRPSVETAQQEEAEARTRDSEEHSHLPVVRHSNKLDLGDSSLSSQDHRELRPNVDTQITP
ncbi:hypothetical protein, unknown function [Leishmania tarentolae]|uniref:Uncharacterized protein n=1 Tax=Leishmania tarentolae TaxID=5689 RepID=A0A640KAY3_LEITA|nr:hypothetical protein, unknown function [Leishmania tarentolae]